MCFREGLAGSIINVSAWDDLFFPKMSCKGLISTKRTRDLLEKYIPPDDLAQMMPQTGKMGQKQVEKTFLFGLGFSVVDIY